MQEDRLYLRFPGSLKKRLREISKEEGRTLSNLIIWILSQFVAGRK